MQTISNSTVEMDILTSIDGALSANEPLAELIDEFCTSDQRVHLKAAVCVALHVIGLYIRQYERDLERREFDRRFTRADAQGQLRLAKTVQRKLTRLLLECPSLPLRAC